MNISLRGKNVLLCGASKGIGRASAVELACLGANVNLVARSDKLLRELVDDLPSAAANQSHDYFPADFSAGEDALKYSLRHLFKKNIHVIINNTGGPAGGSLAKATRRDFDLLSTTIFLSVKLW